MTSYDLDLLHVRTSFYIYIVSRVGICVQIMYEWFHESMKEIFYLEA